MKIPSPPVTFKMRSSHQNLFVSGACPSDKERNKDYLSFGSINLRKKTVLPFDLDKRVKVTKALVYLCKFGGKQTNSLRDFSFSVKFIMTLKMMSLSPKSDQLSILQRFNACPWYLQVSRS